MGSILCATRGGKASYRTQDAAIDLALERGDSLIFLYVVDLNFLGKTAAPIVVNVENEVVKMGEFLLLMAEERAATRGVAAQSIVRHGRLAEELVAAAQELDASLIVLGRPLDDAAVFDREALREFADRLRTATQIEVRIV
jgi:nucleotide-binding universal stress UspA family protein